MVELLVMVAGWEFSIEVNETHLCLHIQNDLSYPRATEQDHQYWIGVERHICGQTAQLYQLTPVQ